MAERECGRRKPTDAAAQCMPRLWRKSAAAAPASLLGRFRVVVFKLIMLSAMSKSVRTRRERTPPGGTACQRHHPDSYRSEAVEDCIEFFKRSAEGAKSSGVGDEALEIGFASLPVM
ncbi:hypothetical protein MUK42_02064 [Musa troglodytarum]|nr:hypothetical protein MUK42_02064 [Musa troglodytarum]